MLSTTAKELRNTRAHCLFAAIIMVNGTDIVGVAEDGFLPSEALNLYPVFTLIIINVFIPNFEPGQSNLKLTVRPIETKTLPHL